MWEAAECAGTVASRRSGNRAASALLQQLQQPRSLLLPPTTATPCALPAATGSRCIPRWPWVPPRTRCAAAAQYMLTMGSWLRCIAAWHCCMPSLICCCGGCSALPSPAPPTCPPPAGHAQPQPDRAGLLLIPHVHGLLLHLLRGGAGRGSEGVVVQVTWEHLPLQGGLHASPAWAGCSSTPRSKRIHPYITSPPSCQVLYLALYLLSWPQWQAPAVALPAALAGLQLAPGAAGGWFLCTLLCLFAAGSAGLFIWPSRPQGVHLILPLPHSCRRNRRPCCAARRRPGGSCSCPRLCSQAAGECGATAHCRAAAGAV